MAKKRGFSDEQCSPLRLGVNGALGDGGPPFALVFGLQIHVPERG